MPPIDRVPVIGYMGFRPVFRHPLREIKKPAVFHDKDPSKFANLSEGFQKQMLENEKFREKVENFFYFHSFMVDFILGNLKKG